MSEDKCKWVYDDDCFYQTSCNNGFFFDTGTATENKFKFCPYCGKELEAIEQEEPDDE